MLTYLLIDTGIIIFPLLYSFERKISFYKRIPAIFFSSVIVGIPYIAWDIFATYRGDWHFNPEYIIGAYIFNLPIEEILFFVTVPYSMIFLYEISKLYLTKKRINIPKKYFAFLSAIFLLMLILNTTRDYTFTVILFNSLLFLLISISKLEIFKKQQFWIYMFLAFIPFIIVNYFLTSIPVVQYATESILNIRIITIPIEDFFYSFSLIAFYIYFYELITHKLLNNK